VAGISPRTTGFGELVYGRITKLVPFGAVRPGGRRIGGPCAYSEMAAHHVDLPEQVSHRFEELWVKIMTSTFNAQDQAFRSSRPPKAGRSPRRYREAFGEHAYDAEGNYIGFDYSATDFTPETESQAAWATSSAANEAESRQRPSELPAHRS